MEFAEAIVNRRKFPFLKFFTNNHLCVDEATISEIMDFPNGVKETKEMLKHFKGQTPIYFPSKVTHDKLLATSNFLEYKSSIINFPETNGLLLLPENLTPNAEGGDLEWRPQDLKMNCILFSFLRWSTADEIRYGRSEKHNLEDYADEEDYNYEKTMYETGRWLYILPIQLDKFFFVDTNSIGSPSEEYGNSFTEYGRDINGNIIDYVWSFLVLLNMQSINPKMQKSITEVILDGNCIKFISLP